MPSDDDDDGGGGSDNGELLRMRMKWVNSSTSGCSKEHKKIPGEDFYSHKEYETFGMVSQQGSILFRFFGFLEQ